MSEFSWEFKIIFLSNIVFGETCTLAAEYRSTRSKMFFKVSVLKNLRPPTLLKRDSNTGVFLWNLQNF